MPLTPVVTDFAGRWVRFQGLPDGKWCERSQWGQLVYLCKAWASGDTSGTGLSLTPNSTLPYMGILVSSGGDCVVDGREFCGPLAIRPGIAGAGKGAAGATGPAGAAGADGDTGGRRANGTGRGTQGPGGRQFLHLRGVGERHERGQLLADARAGVDLSVSAGDHDASHDADGGEFCGAVGEPRGAAGSGGVQWDQRDEWHQWDQRVSLRGLCEQWQWHQLQHGTGGRVRS